jgi:probable rRNA maturation factor
MLTSLELGNAELSVLLTDDRGIQSMNASYRRRNEPTDVLSFAMREGEHVGATSPTGTEILGDIVISVDTAARQARRSRRSIDREIMMLLAHGLLHLVGFDHRNAAETRAMRARTQRLCTAAQSTRKGAVRRDM